MAHLLNRRIERQIGIGVAAVFLLAFSLMLLRAGDVDANPPEHGNDSDGKLYLVYEKAQGEAMKNLVIEYGGTKFTLDSDFRAIPLSSISGSMKVASADYVHKPMFHVSWWSGTGIPEVVREKGADEMGHAIWTFTIPDEITHVELEIWDALKGDQITDNAPEGLTGVVSADGDAAIAGTSAAMQYSMDGGTTWKQCADEKTAASFGTALVRMTGNHDKAPGPSATVHVGIPKPTVEDNVPPDIVYDGWSKTMNLKDYDYAGLVVLTANVATNANNPESPNVAKVTLKPGCCWDDGTETVVLLEWNIAKKVLDASYFKITDFSHTYDGTPKTVSVATVGEWGNQKGTITATYSGSDSQTEAGTYDIVLTLDYQNFTGPVSGFSEKLTISKKEAGGADMNIEPDEGSSFDGGAYVWKFDGKGKSITPTWKRSSAQNNDVVMKYLASGIMDASEASEVGPIDAGIYDVYATVVARDDGNYEATGGDVGDWIPLATIRIDPADAPEVRLEFDGAEAAASSRRSVVYNGKPRLLSASISSALIAGYEGKFTYALDGTEYTAAQMKAQLKDCGVYEVAVRTAVCKAGDAATGQSGNYIAPADVSITIEIGQATLSCGSSQGYEGIYDAAYHTVKLVISGIAPGHATLNWWGICGKTERNPGTATVAMTGNGSLYSAEFSIRVKDVSDSGTMSWYAEAGGNFMRYVPEDGERAAVSIGKAVAGADVFDVRWPDSEQLDDHTLVVYTHEGAGVKPDISWKDGGKGHSSITVVYADDKGRESLDPPTKTGTYDVYLRFDSSDPNYDMPGGGEIYVGTIAVCLEEPEPMPDTGDDDDGIPDPPVWDSGGTASYDEDVKAVLIAVGAVAVMFTAIYIIGWDRKI